MFRCACFANHSSSVITQFSNYQSIRWRKFKKPFWLGIAKTKMFVLPKIKPIPENEKLEKIRLVQLYNTELKSVLRFIKEENPLGPEHLTAECEKKNANEEFMKEIEESFLRNNLWNAKSAELRELRLKESLEEYSSFALTRIKKVEKLQKEMQMKVEKLIEMEKIRSKSFITPDNLDEAVDSCLNHVADYNFAIDLQGNKYTGQTPQKEKDERFESGSVN